MLFALASKNTFMNEDREFPDDEIFKRGFPVLQRDVMGKAVNI